MIWYNLRKTIMNNKYILIVIIQICKCNINKIELFDKKIYNWMDPINPLSTLED